MLASGWSLDALRDELRPALKARLEHAVPALARHGMRDFDVESLPRTVDLAGGLRGFPALVDEGESVGIRICESPGEQAVMMARGTRRLLRLTVPSPAPLGDRATRPAADSRARRRAPRHAGRGDRGCDQTRRSTR